MAIQTKTYLILKEISKSSEPLVKEQIKDNIKNCQLSTLNSLVNRGFLEAVDEKVISKSAEGRSSKKKAYRLSSTGENALNAFEAAYPEKVIKNGGAPPLPEYEKTETEEEVALSLSSLKVFQ